MSRKDLKLLLRMSIVLKIDLKQKRHSSESKVTNFYEFLREV